MHADHAEKMRVVCRDGAEAHQGEGAGHIGAPHQLGKTGAGFAAGIDQPAAAVEQWSPRRGDHCDGLADLRPIGYQPRAIGLVAHRIRPAIGPRREQHVFRQIDDDRPGPAALGDVKRLVQQPRQLADVLDEIIVLGAGPGDAGGVGLLEGVVADQMGRHLAGQADHRHRIHQRIGQAGDGVRRPRTAGHQHRADLSGRAGIAFGGVHRALLMADQDVAQRILLVEGVVDRQYRAARIAENDINALVDQGLDDDLRSAQRLGRHDALLRRI